MTKTIKRPHDIGSGRHLSKHEKERRRAEAVEQIKLLLAIEPMSAPEVSDKLGLHPSTASAHLHYMARTLRIARHSGKQDDRKRALWELGEDLLLPTEEELLEQSFEPKRATVPARRVGMWRDGLVCALFGAPAQALGAAA